MVLVPRHLCRIKFSLYIQLSLSRLILASLISVMGTSIVGQHFFATTFAQGTTPIAPVLIITNNVEPVSDPGRFEISVDNEIVASNVGHGGTIDNLMLDEGDHTIAVSMAPGFSDYIYDTSIICVDQSNNILVNQVSVSVSVELAEGSQVECLIQHRRIPDVTATLTDRLVSDLDAAQNPGPSPGDVIELETVVSSQRGSKASGVSLDVRIDPNTDIISGSVKSSQGSIEVGNAPGDKSVEVKLGEINSTVPATVTFQVRIKNPLQADVDTVIFQGTVSGDNFEALLTDDPVVPGPGNPTEVSVSAKPLLKAIHHGLLLVDRDNNGLFSAGDVIYYEVNLLNIGNSPAFNLVVTSQLDENLVYLDDTLLPIGSVDVTPTATIIRVNIDSLDGGGQRAKFHYQTKIRDDVSADAINSQFTVTFDDPDNPSQRVTLLSDDPRTHESSNDATRIGLFIASPVGPIYLPIIP